MQFVISDHYLCYCRKCYCTKLIAPWEGSLWLQVLNAYCGVRSWAILMELLSDRCHITSWMISQNWLKLWLDVVRQGNKPLHEPMLTQICVTIWQTRTQLVDFRYIEIDMSNSDDSNNCSAGGIFMFWIQEHLRFLVQIHVNFKRIYRWVNARKTHRSYVFLALTHWYDTAYWSMCMISNYFIGLSQF